MVATVEKWRMSVVTRGVWSDLKGIRVLESKGTISPSPFKFDQSCLWELRWTFLSFEQWALECFLLHTLRLPFIPNVLFIKSGPPSLHFFLWSIIKYLAHLANFLSLASSLSLYFVILHPSQLYCVHLPQVTFVFITSVKAPQEYKPCVTFALFLFFSIYYPQVLGHKWTGKKMLIQCSTLSRVQFYGRKHMKPQSKI